MLARLAERKLVLSNLKILASLKQGHRLLSKRLGKVLVLVLVEIGLALGYSVAISLVLLLGGGLLLGIGYWIHSAAQTIGVLIYGIPVSLAFLTALIIAGGIFSAFISAYWTLAYQALVNSTSKVSSVDKV
jgi:hypothetical protein